MLAVYMCDSFSAYRERSHECGCCEVIVLRICSSSHNFCVLGVYRNPDLSDNFFFTVCRRSMAKIPSVESKAYFLFVDEVSAHHEEWLVSSTTTVHVSAAHYFASSSGCG